MASVLVLTGSPSAASRTAALAHHIGGELSLAGHDVSTLAIRTLPPQALLAADTGAPEIAAAVRAVIGVDALVVATPIYKAAYSGLLKAFLDLLPQAALAGKIVLPIATGGTIAHLLAIDYSLRPVLASLGARHVTAGRFVLDVHIDHTSGGPVLVDDAARECVTRTAAAFREAIELAADEDRRLVAAP
ncbi:NADPH-dependent FMN reductase [Actinotalea fermentans]|uniref:FMN reductase (NADPH) n=1 Tax=Actinotalea fermentans TaxID=43671 RepID=A0A511YW08_9CELL|nr:NADPH-dependent FMN reductase [Actinotalea fermentans]KGM15962.1 NADPH-dependent FMN reductase [Actinotalea fermentans ATCC 43279 = JCM 9966 = DSM 3133]GEN79377.1 FMN reductase (NADPH) [Actinotalea fermentans]